MKDYLCFTNGIYTIEYEILMGESIMKFISPLSLSLVSSKRSIQ